MSNITLSVPKELNDAMKRHPEVRWSEVARQAFWAYIKTLEYADAIVKESKISEDEAFKIGETVKRSLATRYHKARRQNK
jgi:hypothetical protein